MRFLQLIAYLVENAMLTRSMPSSTHTLKIYPGTGAHRRLSARTRQIPDKYKFPGL